MWVSNMLLQFLHRRCDLTAIFVELDGQLVTARFRHYFVMEIQYVTHL